MNYTVYCRLAWPKKCIISVKCVTSTTLGDTLRMLGLLRAAPGVVSYFRRKTAMCVSRNRPKSDRCHIGDESPNLSGIGLRCVSCNRPQEVFFILISLPVNPSPDGNDNELLWIMIYILQLLRVVNSTYSHFT